MNPAELEIKDNTESTTSASYLNLLLSIGRDGQLHTSIYDKRDDFNVHIKTFRSWVELFHPAYDVFNSQLIRYARACSSYECFILRARRLSSKLLKQGYLAERLKSSFRKFYGWHGSYSAIWSIPFTNVKWHSDSWPTVTFQPIRLSTNCMTLIPSLTFTDYEWFPLNICNGCGMLAGNAYPSGHLVPSPIVGLACAPIVETRFHELVMSLLDFSPRIPLGTLSILLHKYYEEKIKLSQSLN